MAIGARIAEVLGVIVALAYLLRPIIQWIRARKHSRHERWLALVLAVVPMPYASSNSDAANYALEIIQPRAGLSTTNRFYKAYPGIEYNVRLAVIGGDYPYTFSLTTAPSGMTINATTGEITWSNPTTVGSPHTVTAQVVDRGTSGGGEGTGGASTTVTWTVTVTTSGFLFIDAVNGNDSVAHGGTGTGTLANPFRTIYDWYNGTTGDSTYTTNFVYYRTGTYTLGGSIPRTADSPGYWTQLATAKPLVHLAYPGESPVWDWEFANTFNIYANISNVYFDGLTITNIIRWGLICDSGGSHNTFRRLTLYDLDSTGFPSNLNQSFLFASHGANGSYWSFQDNTMYTATVGTGIKLYGVRYYLVEDNLIYSMTGSSEGIANKTDLGYGFIRHNVVHDVQRLFSSDHYTPVGNLEFSYNNGYSGSSYVFHAGDNSGGTGPVYILRNTFQGSAVEIVGSNTGPYDFTKNVVQNATGIVLNGNPGTLSNNLTGASGLVDATGYLTGANRTTYLGTRGWELGGGSGSMALAMQRVVFFIEGAGGVLVLVHLLSGATWLWSVRGKAAQAAMQTWRYTVEAGAQWYWTVRYTRACRKWQAAAPKMLPPPVQTIAASRVPREQVRL